MSGTETNLGMPMIEPGEYAQRFVSSKRDHPSPPRMREAIAKP